MAGIEMWFSYLKSNMRYLILIFVLSLSGIAYAQVDTNLIMGQWHIRSMQANGIVFDYKNTEAAVNSFLERQQRDLGVPLTKADTTKARFDIAAYVAEQPLNNVEFKQNHVVTFKAALTDAPTYGNYYWAGSNILSVKDNTVMSGIFTVTELSKNKIVLELINEVQMEVNGKIVLTFER